MEQNTENNTRKALELCERFKGYHSSFTKSADGGYTDCEQWGQYNGCAECPFWTPECGCDADEYLELNKDR